MQGFPGVFGDSLNAFLENRFLGIKAHLQPREGSKGSGILQIKSQLFVSEFTILLENGTPQNLVRAHAISAGVIAPALKQIQIDDFQNFGSTIQDLRNSSQFLADDTFMNPVKQQQLSIYSFAHKDSHSREQSCNFNKLET